MRYLFHFSAEYTWDDCISCCQWKSARVECTKSVWPCFDPVDPIATITYGYFDENATDMTICLGPTDPSYLDPPAPAYVPCDASEWVALTFAESGMGAYLDGCGIVNPTREPPVSAGNVSWGTLKGRFGSQENAPHGVSGVASRPPESSRMAPR